MKKTIHTLSIGITALLCSIYSYAFVTEISGKKELDTLLSQTNKRYAYIQFYGDFCAPCKKIHPLIDAISQESEFNDILFLRVNVMHAELADLYEVQVVPTCIMLRRTGSGNNTAWLPDDFLKIQGFKPKESIIYTLRQR